jgi:hypothetical protein
MILTKALREPLWRCALARTILVLQSLAKDIRIQVDVSRFNLANGITLPILKIVWFDAVLIFDNSSI